MDRKTAEKNLQTAKEAANLATKNLKLAEATLAAAVTRIAFDTDSKRAVGALLYHTTRHGNGVEHLRNMEDKYCDVRYTVAKMFDSSSETPLQDVAEAWANANERWMDIGT